MTPARTQKSGSSPAASQRRSEEIAPGLYVVSTPIGNLRDITLRALDVLSAADLVLAEDTRVGGKLLVAHGIKAKLERYDEHAAARVRPRVLAELAAGARIALTSDAGTPLISDPGYRLVKEAAEAGVPVFPIPGASAALAALAVAGLPTDHFFFAGFPPPKSAGRRAAFAALASIPATLVFYEGVSRLAACLADMAEVFGERPAVVARELTKLHETVVRGPLPTLATDPRFETAKGEVVILVGPGAPPEVTDAEVEAALIEALRSEAPAAAAASVAKASGRSKREVYALALAIKDRT